MRRGDGYLLYPSPQATGKRWPYYIELSDRRGCADYERRQATGKRWPVEWVV